MHKLPFVVAASAGAVDAVSSFDLSSVLSQGVTTMQTSIYTTLGIVVPAIVGVTAVVVAVKFGIRWLKKIGHG